LALLDVLGRRYSCRPSAILRGKMLDFHVDLAACLAGLEKEQSSVPKD
jgi:hypothetical protein